MSSALVAPTFSVDSLGKHAAYIQDLSQRYTALSKLAFEEPSSTVRASPEVDEGRVLALRHRVQEAWSKADGNPAEGKWGFLTGLLRMGVTSGRGGRWVGARMDVECPDAPENGLGWLNTMSEEEWREWEQRFNQDQNLKDKVERWKKKVEASHEVGRDTKSSTSQAERKSVAVALSSGTGKSSRLPTIESSLKQAPVVPMDPLKDTAPFGFGVIKRSSQPNVINTKPGGTSKKGPPKDVPGRSSVPEAQNKEPPKEPTDVGQSNKQTTDDPEQSFTTPSFFVSQLVTSTPKQIAKPTLISNIALPSSPLPPLTSSPKANDPDAILANTGESDIQKLQAATSVSLPAIPLPASPVRHTTSTTSHHANSDTNDTFNANKKRILGSSVDGSDEAGRKLKKAKTTPSNASNTPSSVHANLGPSTPPRPVPVGQATSIPTLTELLASAKKGKKKRIVSGRPSFLEKAEQSKPPSSDHQTAGARGQDVGKDMSSVNELLPGLGVEPWQQSHRVEDVPDVDLSSPAKSLSSIAGASDDEAEEEVIEHLEPIGDVDPFVLDSSFHPLATSTQVQRNHHDHDPFLSNTPVIISQSEDSRQREDRDLNAVDSWEGIYEPRQNEANAAPFCTAGHPGPSLSFSSPVNDKNNSNSSDDHPQLSYPVYNSQFESAVAAQVDKVNKVLEQDVDYDSWLNKATAAFKKRSVRKEDDDDDDDDESSSRAISDHEDDSGSKNGGLSYGYGKAFEYDQSF